MAAVPNDDLENDCVTSAIKQAAKHLGYKNCSRK